LTRHRYSGQNNSAGRLAGGVSWCFNGLIAWREHGSEVRALVERQREARNVSDIEAALDLGFVLGASFVEARQPSCVLFRPAESLPAHLRGEDE
jgi:hypothetical protein